MADSKPIGTALQIKTFAQSRAQFDVYFSQTVTLWHNAFLLVRSMNEAMNRSRHHPIDYATGRTGCWEFLPPTLQALPGQR
jgi:hypothetical protein